jgi:glycosyltransferase involved in cell wall biosynthesis
VRILHVTDCYLPRLGGIEMHVHDLVTEQRSRGYDATALTATTGGAFIDDVPVTRLANLRGIPTWSALSQVPDRIAQGRYDVVHAHSSLLSPLAWSAVRAAATAGVPAVATMHSIPPQSGPVRHLLTLVGNAAGRHVEWTAVSPAAAEPLRGILDGRDVAVLPNGIDPARWRTSPRSVDCRPLTVVSVMRLCERKRPLALLHMLAEIRRQVPLAKALRAVIVGSGPQASTVRRALVAHGLDGWVELPGKLARPQIRELFEASDIYLAPAPLESFGIAALEARCAGLAVVAMAGGGIGEFVSHGLEGYLVSSDEDMSQTAARLLTSPELLQSIQRHNRSSVPVMTWDHVLSRSLDAYAKAAALGSTRPDASTAVPSHP